MEDAHCPAQSLMQSASSSNRQYSAASEEGVLRSPSRRLFCGQIKGRRANSDGVSGYLQRATALIAPYPCRFLPANPNRIGASQPDHPLLRPRNVRNGSCTRWFVAGSDWKNHRWGRTRILSTPRPCSLRQRFIGQTNRAKQNCQNQRRPAHR